MKVCTKCKVEKELTEFYFCKKRNKPYSACKQCKYEQGYDKTLLRNKQYKKKYYKECKSHGFFVYLLPKEHYVGQTENIKYRIWDHKSKHNRDTTDYKILHKCTTREEAMRLERSYHEKGYKG